MSEMTRKLEKARHAEADFLAYEDAVGEYLREAYRRGNLDGIDKGADDMEPSRDFDEEAVKKVADDLLEMSQGLTS